MVGIVVVSHSATLAEGVVELAREMGGADARVEAAGGIRVDGQPAVGTDAQLVLEAVDRAWSDDGVLILMDLGSAVLSAEMAVEMLPPERRRRVLLCSAPLVEGAVAAAAVARLGKALEEVGSEAMGGLASKAAHLGEEAGAAPEPEGPAAEEGALEARIAVTNPLGLHARPAARFVQTAGSFDADVRVANATTGRGPASARSLNAVATLGVRQGHEIVVRATGPQAGEALAALRDLAATGFGDEPAGEVAAPRAVVPTAGAPEGPASAAVAEEDAGVLAAAAGARAALVGLPASWGIALGPAVRPRAVEPPVPEDEATDPEAEWEGLGRALAAVGEDIARARSALAARAGEYEASILDAHLLFLSDEELVEPARRAIHERRHRAARAWRDAAEAVAARYRALEDEYLRARAEDVAGVARRVLLELAGEVPSVGPSAPGILVVEELAPTDAAELDPALVLGIVTAGGGPTSHSAILARSLGIPAVVGAGPGAASIAEGTELLIDGETGVVLVEPDPGTVREHLERREVTERARREAGERAHEPAVTRDGRRVEVAANAGGREDAVAAVRAGAEGIGLLRTEFLFLDRPSLPSEEEQYRAYLEIAEALEGRPLTLRTLDAGADKPLPALPGPPEANPFLGVRGIRVGLARPDVLRPQLRAALRVAARHPVRVMFPMVATAEELREARAVLEECRRELAAEGIRPGPGFEVGIMVEVPSAALLADALAPEVDFFSIGTNDLSQYVLAADRGNERVAGMADVLHPAVLRLIGEVAGAGERRGRWVGVCGEAAGDLVAVPLLVGLGVTELSVAPPAVAPVKQAVRELDVAAARDLAAEALALESAPAVRDLVSRRGANLTPSVADGASPDG